MELLQGLEGSVETCPRHREKRLRQLEACRQRIEGLFNDVDKADNGVNAIANSEDLFNFHLALDGLIKEKSVEDGLVEVVFNDKTIQQYITYLPAAKRHLDTHIAIGQIGYGEFGENATHEQKITVELIQLYILEVGKIRRHLLVHPNVRKQVRSVVREHFLIKQMILSNENVKKDLLEYVQVTVVLVHQQYFLDLLRKDLDAKRFLDEDADYFEALSTLMNHNRIQQSVLNYPKIQSALLRNAGVRDIIKQQKDIQWVLNQQQSVSSYVSALESLYI